MDPKPFLTLNLLDVQEDLVNELKRISKASFDLEQMLTAAQELKITREVKRILTEEFNQPTVEFIRYFAAQIHQGAITERVRMQYAPIIKNAFRHFISDHINSRLKSAMNDTGSEAAALVSSSNSPAQSSEESGSLPDENGIITTEDELEGFRIVRAILREVVDVSGVVHRDTKSYFGILLDDNNRRPICRLHFNSSSKKYIGIMDHMRNETRHELANVDDIYKFAEALKETVRRYEHQRSTESLK